MSTETLRGGDAVSLSLKSDPRHLCLVRTMVRTFATLAGFPEDRAHRIVLAVDEGCTNIIRHAYQGRPDGDIEVSCRLESADGTVRLVVRLVDRGLAMGEYAPPPRPGSGPLVPGGLGIQLMRDIMDGMSRQSLPDGANLLELVAVL